MTAVVEVLIQRKENILLVPRRAVTTEQGKQTVLIPSKAPPDPNVKTKAGEPNSEKREIKTGLTNNEAFEVVQGLKRGDQVLVRDVVTTVNPMSGGAGGGGRGR
jgi:multidrug efflux pump subunit AcrA (membrane-fusion protein)